MTPAAAVLQMQTHRIQQALRQLLAAIHRNLPGTVAQRRIAETLDQQRRVGVEIGTFRHRQRWRLLLHHQRKRRFAVCWIGHGVSDGFITAEIAQISEERVATVEHAQFHHFKRHYVGNKLCADFVPVRATVNKVVFNHPLAERFAGDSARIVNAQLVGNLLQRFWRCRRNNAVYHGARESGVCFNPLRQLRVTRLRQAQHRDFRHMPIFTHVIAGHNGKGRQPLLTTQMQRLYDVTNRRFRRGWICQIVFNQRVIEI